MNDQRWTREDNVFSFRDNDNCLEGMRCPRCGQSEVFSVQRTCWALRDDDGDHEESYFEDTGEYQCKECYFGGTWNVFDARRQLAYMAAQMLNGSCDLLLEQHSWQLEKPDEDAVLPVEPVDGGAWVSIRMFLPQSEIDELAEQYWTELT